MVDVSGRHLGLLVDRREGDGFEAAGGRQVAEVDRAVALSGAELAEILGPDGLVRASSDPSRLGERTRVGAAETGRAWFGDADTCS